MLMQIILRFLEIYNDPNHPKHAEAKAWAEKLNFKEYDPDLINEKLKEINYKKTEWDKIEHAYYELIKDKYGK